MTHTHNVPHRTYIQLQNYRSMILQTFNPRSSFRSTFETSLILRVISEELTSSHDRCVVVLYSSEQKFVARVPEFPPLLLDLMSWSSFYAYSPESELKDLLTE